MGASSSKSEVLNTIMNTASMEVLNRNTTASTGLITQNNTLTLAGDVGSTYSGISQINSSKINIAGLQSSVQNGSLQSDLSATLANTIKQQAAAIGYSANDSKVSSIVSATIATKVTNETFQSIKAQVSQGNTLNLLDNNSTYVTHLVQKNEAQLIIKLVTDINSTILSELKTQGAISTDIDQSTSSLFSTFVGLAILLVVVFGGLWLAKGTVDTAVVNITKPAPMILIGGILAVFFFMRK
jgi:hypothetical protein